MLLPIICLLFVSLVLLECLLRMPLLRQAAVLFGIYQKLFSVLRLKNVSDHWKERVIAHYNLKAFMLLMQMGFQFAMLCVVGVGFLMLVQMFLAFSPSVWVLMQEWYVLFLLVVVSMGYYWLRRNI